ncbi:MAG: penicillin-binding transpeptidase domain-containing protein [Patescibacteria group bacterium]|nr:hypothetical protein [Patescibacteria group bacterium]
MNFSLRFFRWLVFIVLGIFLTRSIDLMLIKGAYFRKLSDLNRVRRIKILPARGRIIDSNGLDLARNAVEYLNEAGEKLSREIALKMEAEGNENLVKNWVREYPFGLMAAHITGYLGEISSEEISSEVKSDLEMSDLVGRSGLEQFYDSFLRGLPGERLVEVGAKEEVIRQLAKREAKAGEDLVLTLDLNWQRAVWEAFSGKKGAVVILSPETGAVLALVSQPSFDPNLFTKNRDEEKIFKLLNDSDLPFLNRAIGGAYPPGSTFKIVTAIAGLEENEIDADKEVEDTGEIKIGEWRFGNWYWLEYGRTEGMVNLVKALKRSNDIYFYKVGEWLGIGRLLSWADKFNTGRITGIDLPGEVAGFLPSPSWKEETRGERWFLGNTYHLAIGQGDLTMTPLQVALETAVIASGGKLCRPHLSGGVGCSELGADPKNIDLIKEGMIAVCSSGGTGFPFFDFKPQVGCKTGTAELGDIGKNSHAWFTLFYPADNESGGGQNKDISGVALDDSPGVGQQRVVITVLVEKGGSGAYVAAPIAKEIIERYEGRQLSPKPVVSDQ